MTDGVGPNRVRLAVRVAANVRSALAWRDIKPKELEAPLRLSQAGISRRLTGHVPFDVVELQLIAGLVGMTAGRLMDGEPWPAKPEPVQEEEVPATT